jgi:signal peptidase II
MNTRLNRSLGAGLVLIVAIDWLTKFWIVNRMRVGETHSLIDGWLYLAHRRNTGVAFSMFADLPEPLRLPMLALLALIGMSVLGWMAWSSDSNWIRAGSSLALGGAAANLGDRLVHGGVTDFILFSPFPFVFNVADAAITVGAVVLASQALFEGRGTAPPAAA